MRAYERLLNYVVVRTPSDENCENVPSSQCQFDLAKILVEELKQLGIDNAYVNDKCFVYAKLPATPGYEDKTKLGFIAHMDTVADFCDHDIVPVITENYNGEDLVLGTSGRTLAVADFPHLGFIAHMDTVADFCDHDIVPVITENYNGEDLVLGTSGRTLAVADFPHLPSLKGRTLITSDGTTILGADNKAGIAEIMTMLERIINENIPHGQISVAFTPDEEIGTGAQSFDVEAFDADFGYTLDGDLEGEIQYENFNAYKATFDITGFSVHPGSSKNTMINASLVAMEINSMLPAGETPRGTEARNRRLRRFLSSCKHER